MSNPAPVDFVVRPALAQDAAAIATIYNHYVRHTFVTFEEEDVSAATMAERMHDVFRAELPWFVAELDGQLRGYAYATKWKPRFGYRFSVETSVHVDHDRGGHGVGSALYGVLLPELAARGFRTANGGIALPNDASVRLHEKFGFTKVGEFRDIGTKFDTWTPVGYWQKLLDESE